MVLLAAFRRSSSSLNLVISSRLLAGNGAGGFANLFCPWLLNVGFALTFNYFKISFVGDQIRIHLRQSMVFGRRFVSGSNRACLGLACSSCPVPETCPPRCTSSPWRGQFPCARRHSEIKTRNKFRQRIFSSLDFGFYLGKGVLGHLTGFDENIIFDFVVPNVVAKLVRFPFVNRRIAGDGSAIGC